MQIMPAAEAAKYRLNPFDVTKVWPHRDYPLMTIGRIVLNRNPDNYFAEVEQAAFNPAHFVPGIGPSPDKMLQGRLNLVLRIACFSILKGQFGDAVHSKSDVGLISKILCTVVMP